MHCIAVLGLKTENLILEMNDKMMIKIDWINWIWRDWIGWFKNNTYMTEAIDHDVIHLGLTWLQKENINNNSK